MASLLDLGNKLKNLFGGAIHNVEGAYNTVTQPVKNFDQSLNSSINNFRFSPNLPTVGQAFHSSIQNNLPRALATPQNFGNPVLNSVDRNVFQPTGQALNNTFKGLSLGLYNQNIPQPTNIPQRIGGYIGTGAGLIGALPIGGAAFKPLTSVGEVAGKSLLGSREVPLLLKKAIPAITSEIGNAGAFSGAQALTGNKVTPIQNLAYNLGGRAAFGAGNSVFQGLKGINPRAFDLSEESVKEAEQILDTLKSPKGRTKAQFNDAQKGLQNFLDQYTPGYKMATNKDGIKVMEGILNAHYGQGVGKLPAMGIVDNTNGASSTLKFSPTEKPATINIKSEPQILNTGSKIPNLLQNESKSSPKNLKINPSEGNIPQTEQYINDLVKKQSDAGSIEKGGKLQQGKSFLSQLKTKLVDSTAPIEDLLGQAQKKGNFQVLPSKDISNQIDRAIRSRELAGQFLKDNGLVNVIRDVPNIDALNQYLIAKHAPEVAAAGFKTGRDSAKDTQLVKDLAPTYEPFAQKVTQYGQKLLDYAVQTGLVTQESATALKQKYPNYVPLNRIFNELEKTSIPEGVGGKGVASLSKQSVVQKLQGSERAIKNPIESLLTKTVDAFSQGERNQAGQILASYKDLPGFEGLIKEVPKGENNPPNTFSFLENGVKKTFETTPEIASAAKFLDKRQLGFIGNIFATPVRLARVGITGVNIPFIAANLAKDQVSAFINSDHALQTSIANPKVFLKSIWTAIGHGNEYDNWIRSAGGGTSFDISRSEPNTSIAQIRSGKNVKSKIGYTVTHPSQLLRTVESIVSRGEETTRLQQYIGTRDALIKQGRTPQDAEILATKASRQNTVDFARSGDWGKALNSVFLYMNAGIQGSRTLLRNLEQKPVQTATKIGLSVFVPVAAVTAWNLSDPKRAAAYNDIQNYEKDNNLVIVPPNPTKDPKTGKWNVIKVPFSQEVASLTVPIRKGIEGLKGYDGPGFGDFASAIIGSTTSLNAQNPSQIAGQFIPQAIKPELEATLNKNTFTNTDIVPQYINGQASKNLPPNMQAYPDTSGTAREIGGVLNTSPLKVNQFIHSTLGGVGDQVINASDRAQASAGIIPKEQIGGQSITQGLAGRFSQAAGGQQLNNLYSKGTTVGPSSPAMKNTNNGNTLGSNIVENRGKYYVSLGNGNVKSYNSLKEAQNVLVTKDNNTIDLSPPTKGKGIDAFTNQDWEYSKARDVYKAQASGNLSQQQANAAYKKLGVDSNDVEYDYKATHTNDIKTQYLISKSPDHNTLLNNILTGRVVSVSGTQFAADGVLTNLYNQGLISKAEEAALKKIKVDKNGNSLVKASGGGKKGAKITVSSHKVSAPSTSTFKMSAPPVLKLTPPPIIAKPTTIKTVKPSKFVPKAYKNTLLNIK